MPVDFTLDDWLPVDGGLEVPATTLIVYRIADDGTLEQMDNLEPLSVTWPSGAKPKSARIAFKFDDYSDEDTPKWIEEALSLRITGGKVVLTGDRLAILAIKPDGSTYWLFDGHPYGWEAIVTDDGERVVMQCIGVEKVLWDKPIKGELLRNGDTPDDPGAAGSPNHVQTDCIAIFNPGGIDNCTPDEKDYNPRTGTDVSRKYPVFLDKSLTTKTTQWHLNKSVAHLLYVNNDEEIVENPDRETLDDTLFAREPIEGEVFDPEDPETYTETPIETPAVPIKGRPMPPVVEGLIADKDFAFDFRLETPYEGSLPVHKIDIYHKQTTPIYNLLLQAQGSVPDIQLTNIGDCHLTRDISEAINQWEVSGRLVRYEISGVLFPLFPMQSNDVSSGNGVEDYTLTNIELSGSTVNLNRYRLFGLDELGEGHYKPGTNTALLTMPKPNFDTVFGTVSGSTRTYANRRRPPQDEMFSLDADGTSMRHVVEYCTDFGGTGPGVNSKSPGTWKVLPGGYDVCKDRFGIWINVESPNALKVDDKTVLRLVESLASPDAVNNPPIFFRLTAVVESDKNVTYLAQRRDTSLLPEELTRVVDASDRYEKNIVTAGSKYNTTTTDDVKRDDTDLCKAEAIALRDSTDGGVLDGPVIIPWFTMHYRPGDRIEAIEGRNLELRTDGGDDTVTPVLPSIRSIHWDDLSGFQSTHLDISDGSSVRKSYSRKIRAGAARGAHQHV